MSKTTTTPTVEQAATALAKRAAEIGDEIIDLQRDRGRLALAVALDPSQAAGLDKLDAELAALDRERIDVAAALTEARHQLREARDRDRLADAKKALGELPGAEAGLRKVYSKLATAIETARAAIVEARQAEAIVNAIADRATPTGSGYFDASEHGGIHFNASDALQFLAERITTAGADDQPFTASDLVSQQFDERGPRIRTLHERCVADLERELADARAGIKRDGRLVDQGTIKQVWPQGERREPGVSFTDAWGAPPPAAA